MRHYAFLEKIIKHPTYAFNMVDEICRDDRALSEKFAYLALYEANKVNQSDEVKPIILAMQRFLEIKDEHQDERVKWLVGIPQYTENLRTGSFGAFGVNPESEMIVEFISPVRASPLAQLLYKYKIKAQHVCALLFTFLLQM